MCRTMNKLEKVVADYRALKAMKEQLEEELKAVEREIIGYLDSKTKICEYRSLPRVLCDFDTVVMDENTWNAIKKASLPTFLDNLKKLLDSYSDEEFMLTIRYFYILHIDLAETPNTALVSLQRNRGYEFVFKDVPVSFAEEKKEV